MSFLLPILELDKRMGLVPLDRFSVETFGLSDH